MTTALLFGFLVVPASDFLIADISVVSLEDELVPWSPSGAEVVLVLVDVVEQGRYVLLLDLILGFRSSSSEVFKIVVPVSCCSCSRLRLFISKIFFSIISFRCAVC